MLEDWKLDKSKQIFASGPFNVLQKDYIKPEEEGEFKAYVLDLPDWVMIIAFNEEDHILLIRQFRFGTNKIELEIPAGYIEPGESPKEAAIRELKEETGYSVKNVKQIGVVDANPAIMNNKCYTFLAELSEKGDIKLDPDEIIETEFATQSQCFEYLRQGIIKNAYIVVAFFWFALYNKTI